MAQGWRNTDVNSSPVLVGHTVWAVDRYGTLHALDAATGAAKATVGVGAASRFATPAVSGAVLVVPTVTGVTAVAITRCRTPARGATARRNRRARKMRI